MDAQVSNGKDYTEQIETLDLNIKNINKTVEGTQKRIDSFKNEIKVKHLHFKICKIFIN